MSPPGAAVDDLSALDVGAVDTAAGVLTGTATATRTAVSSVAAARASTPQWRGQASAASTAAGGVIDHHLEVLLHTAQAGAHLLERYARELSERKLRMAVLARSAAEAERRLQRVEALTTFSADVVEADRLHRERQLLVAEQDAAVRDLAMRLDGLIHDIADRPRSWGEHLSGAAGAFVREGVTGPAEDLGFLALGWTRDADAWWRTVRSLPAGYVDDLLHPVRAGAEALHVEDFAEGRTGEGIGALAAAVAGRGVARVLDRTPGGRRRPAPPSQSFDEMLAGVDLDRHEHGNAAHTLSRHVLVDDGYLRDRLLHGTLLADGTRKLPAPSTVSRWADQGTAERHITQALRDHEASIRRSIATGEQRIELRVAVPSSAGHVMSRSGGDFSTAPAASADIHLKVRGGSLILVTAFLNGATR